MEMIITVEYKERIFTSSKKEINKEELIELEKLIERISKGEFSYFSMEIEEKNTTSIYFPKKVLEESIISLKVIN